MRHSISREQRFSADAAHELRTPLTAIKTHLQVARRVDDDASKQALLQAEQGVSRLESTLEQLLVLARIEKGREGLSSGPCQLPDALSNTLDEVAIRVGEERLRVVGETPPVAVALSCEMLGLVFRNLLDNAFTHGPAEGTVTLSADLERAHGGGPQRVAIHVVDQGCGIDAASLSNVTQRFWREGSPSGSGLGLAIVVAILDHIDGTLAFQPLSDGFEACVTLPCHGRVTRA